MMNVKKSGWAGKAKVALVLSTVAVFSLVMIQCNSNEQVLLEPQASSSLAASNGIDVPILSESEYKFKLASYHNTLNLTIDENKVTINGEAVEVKQIPAVVENVYDEQTVVISRIDRTQPMALVRDVHDEFRKANLLKFLYIGQTSTGEQVDVPLRLPPFPGNAQGIQLPAIDDEYARENNMDLLKIQMGENPGPSIQQKVYDFVKGQVAAKKSNYVVSARFRNDDTYNDYLVNVFYMQEGFFQIYGERAQAMYGMNFSEIFKEKATNDDYAEIYDAIKKDVPMAISIAED